MIKNRRHFRNLFPSVFSSGPRSIGTIGCLVTSFAIAGLICVGGWVGGWTARYSTIGCLVTSFAIAEQWQKKVMRQPIVE